MSRHEGFTPELWVLGKMRALPGDNADLYLDSAGFMGLNDESPEGAVSMPPWRDVKLLEWLLFMQNTALPCEER